MKTHPENTCQNALEVLMVEMENKLLTEDDLLRLYQQFPACADQIRSTHEVWQNLEGVEVPENFEIREEVGGREEFEIRESEICSVTVRL